MLGRLHSFGACALLALLGAAAQAPAQAPGTRDAHRGRIPIRVHRAGEERGVAGVAVRVLDELDWLWFPEMELQVVFERMSRLLPSTTSGAEGVAWVPRPNGGFLAVAESPGWFGVLRTRASGDVPLELELRPDPELQVRVLDAEHHPVAGQVVALLFRDAGGRHVPQGTATTGSDGVATLHPGRRLDAAGDGTWLVIVANADPAAPTRVVDLAHAPRDPLELVLPPAGVLDVLVVDSEEKPVEGPGIATLNVDALPSADALRDPLAGPEGTFVEALRDACSVPIVDGHGRFAHTPVGVDLAVRIGTRGIPAEPGLPVRIGAPGEHVERTFHLASALPGIRARLLDADGSPLAATPILLRWGDGDQPTRLETDAKGVLYAVPFLEEAAQLCLTTAQPGRPHLFVTLALDPKDAGVRELGDLRLAPAPLLASGRVVDETGAPFARASILVRELHEPSPGAGGGTERAPSRARRDLFAATDDDGRFELHGVATGKLLVSAHHDDGLDIGVFEPARTDACLVLARTGSIEAHLRFEDGLQAPVDVVALGPDGSCVGRPSMRNGVFRVDGLAPGTYALRCQWSRAEIVLAEFSDVVVRAGETNREARFNPLDLTGKLHRITLDVRADPAPANSVALALVRETGGTRSFATNVALGGPSTFTAPWPLVDVEVRAEGLRTAELPQIAGAASVTLVPGLPIELVLDAASLVRLGARNLELEVHREAAEGRPSVVRLDSGRATLRVGEPGRYTLQAILAEKQPGLRVSPRYANLPTIEVRDGNEPQRFVLTLDDKACSDLRL